MKSSAKILAAALAPILLLCVAATEKKGPKDDPGIEVGQDARGLRFPVFDEAGALQMYFVIDVAKRIDMNHMEMSKVELQTFDNQKNQDMQIEMKNAILDLNTRVVTTEQPVRIVRADFELTGDRAYYDTVNGNGKVAGKVRMLIFDRTGMLGGKAAGS